MALNNFHTPGPQTDVRNLMLAQLNQSSLANNIFNSTLGEMNKFDTGARNLNTQKLTRDIANMSLSELEEHLWIFLMKKMVQVLCIMKLTLIF